MLDKLGLCGKYLHGTCPGNCNKKHEDRYPCDVFKEHGKCERGDKCAYSHGKHVRQRPDSSGNPGGGGGNNGGHATVSHLAKGGGKGYKGSATRSASGNHVLPAKKPDPDKTCSVCDRKYRNHPQDKGWCRAKNGN